MMNFGSGQKTLEAFREANREVGYVEPLDDEEEEYLGDVYGVVVFEDSAGNVEVEYYDSKRDLEENWSRIQAEAEEFYNTGYCPSCGDEMKYRQSDETFWCKKCRKRWDRDEITDY